MTDTTVYDKTGDRPSTYTVGIREQCPAVEVRDHAIYASEPALAEAYEHLPEAKIAAIYDGVIWDFWNFWVPNIAATYSYETASAGRMNGWLIVRHGHRDFLDYVIDGAGPASRGSWTIPPADDTADDDTREEYADAIAARDRFLDFARDIAAEVKNAQNQFRERLGEAMTELSERREANIVRGEN